MWLETSGLCINSSDITFVNNGILFWFHMLLYIKVDVIESQWYYRFIWDYPAQSVSAHCCTFKHMTYVISQRSSHDMTHFSCDDVNMCLTVGVGCNFAASLGATFPFSLSLMVCEAELKHEVVLHAADCDDVWMCADMCTLYNSNGWCRDKCDCERIKERRQ